MTDEYVIDGQSGSVTVAAGVLESVVVGAAESVDGARVRRPRRGLEIELDGSHATVSLELAVRYGDVLPDVAREVQRAIADALRSMCGIEATAVDVAVEELER